MKGFEYGRIDVPADKDVLPSAIKLLMKSGSSEVMLQTMKPNTFAWITPPDKEGAVEFYLILQGHLQIQYDNETKILGPHEYFYVTDLDQDVLLRNDEYVQILFFSTEPTYNTIEQFSEHLRVILRQINEKDAYTYGHSERVMEYSVQISNALKLEVGTIEQIALSAAFHDVGKCEVADSILTKADKLTNEEYAIMKQHPIHSRKILEKRFGSRIGKIVEQHHEREDGSGYPYGLTEDQILYEAKIIAVADSFDAMTSKRIYSAPKTFEEALQDLKSTPNKYNQNIVNILVELVKNGAIKQRD